MTIQRVEVVHCTDCPFCKWQSGLPHRCALDTTDESDQANVIRTRDYILPLGCPLQSCDVLVALKERR